jgi:hypothetical protein
VPARSVDEVDGIHAHPVGLAEMSEPSHVCLAAATASEVRADHEQSGSQAADEPPRHKVRGRLRGQLLGERQHDDDVDTDRQGVVDSVLEPHQLTRCGSRSEHGQGMRSKRHQDGR